MKEMIDVKMVKEEISSMDELHLMFKQTGKEPNWQFIGLGTKATINELNSDEIKTVIMEEYNSKKFIGTMLASMAGSEPEEAMTTQYIFVPLESGTFLKHTPIMQEMLKETKEATND